MAILSTSPRNQNLEADAALAHLLDKAKPRDIDTVKNYLNCPCARPAISLPIAAIAASAPSCVINHGRAMDARPDFPQTRIQ